MTCFFPDTVSLYSTPPILENKSEIYNKIKNRAIVWEVSCPIRKPILRLLALFGTANLINTAGISATLEKYETDSPCSLVWCLNVCLHGQTFHHVMLALTFVFLLQMSLAERQ